jgi:hypothetical protein
MDTLGWTYIPLDSPTPFLALDIPFLTISQHPSRLCSNGHLKINQGAEPQYDSLPQVAQSHVDSISRKDRWFQGHQGHQGHQGQEC